MIPAQIIKKKRDGGELSRDELSFIVGGYTQGAIPDYQMSALLMAIVLKGMTPEETALLTELMLNSGERMQFPATMRAVDKHSTGGVGDKTSLIIAPLVAACGVPVPMMSGRGLGHSGGTVDKLESIPGFTCELPLAKFKELVMQNYIAMVGQSSRICPADKKIYGLRDVTATVESLPLICASIMSKKIAEGIQGLVLDVKCGSGAFMKTYEDARKLAHGLMTIGSAYHLTIRTLITNMYQPLGAMVGNGVEVLECIAIMQNSECLGAPPQEFADCKELSLELAANMLMVADDRLTEAQARNRVNENLTNGKAYEVFEKMVAAQGGRLRELAKPQRSVAVRTNKGGIISSMHTELIGLAGIELGAGRKFAGEPLDPVAGIRVHHKIGQRVNNKDVLFTIFPGANEKGIAAATDLLLRSVALGEEATAPEPLIFDRLVN